MSRFSMLGWPVLRQALSKDTQGRGPAVASPKSQHMRPRTEDADKVVQSVCPYCAVGCGQRIFVKDDEVIHIEGDPDRKSTRLNSSHVAISYAVFCLKKKTRKHT